MTPSASRIHELTRDKARSGHFSTGSSFNGRGTARNAHDSAEPARDGGQSACANHKISLVRNLHCRSATISWQQTPLDALLSTPLCYSFACQHSWPVPLQNPAMLADVEVLLLDIGMAPSCVAWFIWPRIILPPTAWIVCCVVLQPPCFS